MRMVHHYQFWAICTNILAGLYAAMNHLHLSNIYWAGYARSSPALMSAHRYWCRKMGHAIEGPSEDWLSDDSESSANEANEGFRRWANTVFTGEFQDRGSDDELIDRKSVV